MKKLILALSISSAISGYAMADATAAADLTFEVGSPIQSQIDCSTDLVPGVLKSTFDCSTIVWGDAAYLAENEDVAAAAAQVTAEAALTAATAAQAHPSNRLAALDFPWYDAYGFLFRVGALYTWKSLRLLQ